MSCRKGRHGQIKGDSRARFEREKDLSQKRIEVHGKVMRTQPRHYRYGGLRDIGKYNGPMLRKLRALRGVGPAVRIRPVFSYGG